MPLKFAAGIVFAVLCAAAQAQIFDRSVDPDWKEASAPPPPALRTEGLIPLEMPGSQLRFGVDPASIFVGKDGVVHYVVVATSSSGAVNAMYEALRCDAAQVKLQARHTPGAGWVPVKEPEWKSLYGQLTSHSLVIARGGACVGRAANQSAQYIARDLRSSPDMRFRPEMR